MVVHFGLSKIYIDDIALETIPPDDERLLENIFDEVSGALEVCNVLMSMDIQVQDITRRDARSMNDGGYPGLTVVRYNYATLSHSSPRKCVLQDNNHP
ncbi:predicted protein [Lichtheimia corymbifera JMRC:FSU:9682]|uniref:Uncharacterized protein n=1 Tax=Lichtheimia corymbifera JMRC:FSU:9682 TaxID=1263082 RepID=A0A068SEL1_9FUNG|nr:predicted protein [Lichtheimia corymbifera JMRC:FSU:9682]